MPTPAPARSSAPDLRGRGTARTAFSLIEILIALGITTFVLISLFGLLSVGLNAGKHSQIDTLEVMVAQEVVASLHTNTLSRWDSLTFRTNYFDYGGKPLDTASGAYFACIVTPLGRDPAASPWATNLFRNFTVTLLSPAQSKTPTTHVFHCAIAKPAN